jgi:hypothetical protein
LEKRIEEHKKKLVSPELVYPNWDKVPEKEKQGLPTHWEKEIHNFEEQIEEIKDELKRRGEVI